MVNLRNSSNSIHYCINLSSYYYPFGMQMKERSFSSGSYAFGFNGMEKDDDVKGDGNSLDFGARIYDSRLGRWLSVDPLESNYPNLSAYSFANNNPVLLIELDGMSFINPYTQLKEKWQSVVNDNEIVLQTLYGKYGKDVEHLRRKDFKKTRVNRKDKSWKKIYDTYKGDRNRLNGYKITLSQIKAKEIEADHQLKTLGNSYPTVYNYFNDYYFNGKQCDVILVINFVEYNEYNSLSEWGFTTFASKTVTGSVISDPNIKQISIGQDNAIPISVAVCNNAPNDKKINSPLKTLLHEFGHLLAGTKYKKEEDQWYIDKKQDPNTRNGHEPGSPSKSLIDQFEQKHKDGKDFDPDKINP